jgi:hypothetical protein
MEVTYPPPPGLTGSYRPRYDANNNGRLNRLRVKAILTRLNDDIPVTNAEADWVMEATDVDGSGDLTRSELRASVALWYFHVISSAVDPRRGVGSVIPWGYSIVAGVACACLVAWYSVNWSEEKTIGWCAATALSTMCLEFSGPFSESLNGKTPFFL